MERWDVRRMLSWMEGYLAEHGDADPRVSARWLVSDVVGLSFMELYTNLDRPLDQGELDSLRDHVKRRAKGEPLQYIVGKTGFRHIDVIVRDGVLIPRPETEVLVSEVLKRLPRERFASGDAECEEPDLLVADICTGSGCIACSIAHENPRTRVVATDVSSECVALAEENARSLGLARRIDVIECDLGEGVSASDLGAFDAIVSNPPYVPTAALAKLPDEVALHEPALALDGGEDGLDIFRRLLVWAHDALKSDGFLAVELHETTLDAAARLAVDAGFASASVVRDLNGLPRVLVANMSDVQGEGEVPDER